jgi:hypothetical protein
MRLDLVGVPSKLTLEPGNTFNLDREYVSEPLLELARKCCIRELPPRPFALSFVNLEIVLPVLRTGIRQNTGPEGKNRAIFNAVRTALTTSGIDHRCWKYAATDAVNKLNFII